MNWVAPLSCVETFSLRWWASRLWLSAIRDYHYTARPTLTSNTHDADQPTQCCTLQSSVDYSSRESHSNTYQAPPLSRQYRNDASSSQQCFFTTFMPTMSHNLRGYDSRKLTTSYSIRNDTKPSLQPHIAAMFRSLQKLPVCSPWLRQEKTKNYSSNFSITNPTQERRNHQTAASKTLLYMPPSHPNCKLSQKHNLLSSELLHYAIRLRRFLLSGQ